MCMIRTVFAVEYNRNLIMFILVLVFIIICTKKLYFKNDSVYYKTEKNMNNPKGKSYETIFRISD